MSSISINQCPNYVYFTAILIFVFNTIISNFITNHVKVPYMDEIFHIPQAQKYCDGNFTEVKHFLY
jgi:hypothetical protein